MLEINDLKKTFDNGTPALRGINWNSSYLYLLDIFRRFDKEDFILKKSID